MWSERGEEEGHPLTLISKPDQGGTDGDECNASWTEKCDVVPIDTARQGVDSAFSSESGDIRFQSPAQLDGAKGGLGRRTSTIIVKGMYSW